MVVLALRFSGMLSSHKDGSSAPKPGHSKKGRPRKLHFGRNGVNSDAFEAYMRFAWKSFGLHMLGEPRESAGMLTGYLPSALNCSAAKSRIKDSVTQGNADVRTVFGCLFSGFLQTKHGTRVERVFFAIFCLFFVVFCVVFCCFSCDLGTWPPGPACPPRLLGLQCIFLPTMTGQGSLLCSHVSVLQGFLSRPSQA